MFPIRDHNPSGITPLVTWGLILLNVLIHALVWTTATSDPALWRLYDAFAMIPLEVSHGQDLKTLATSTFLHAGWVHLAGNMLFLWIFGDNLEEAMGRIGFLLFYLACGVGANLCQWAAEPLSRVPTIGASGAIAGVMGGYLLLFPRARVDVLVLLVRVVPVPAWAMLGLWLALQVASGLGANPLDGGVAYWAHAGGFAVGLALALPAWLRRGGTASWSQGGEAPGGRPPHSAATYGALTPTRVPVVRRSR